EASVIVTTQALKGRVPKDRLPNLKHIILIDGEGELGERELSYNELMAAASEDLDIEWVDLEHPMILHYTSGSTGKPKGVVHVHGAMIQQYISGDWVTGLRDDDVYWCTADPGWVTGTSYRIFAPWLNGATNLVRGGRYSADRWYSTIQDYKVTVWYSAPTA